MEINWHTEETIRWCWNTPSYKSELTRLIEDEIEFGIKVNRCINFFNRELSEDMMVDVSRVDFKIVYAKFCELLDVPCHYYDLPLPDVDFLDDYEGIEELRIKNIQYSLNPDDCIDCRQCFDDDLDVCAWDDSQIVSIKTRRFENGEWVEHTLTDEDEIRKYVAEEKRKEKEAEDRQWKRNLMREIYDR